MSWTASRERAGFDVAVVDMGAASWVDCDWRIASLAWVVPGALMVSTLALIASIDILLLGPTVLVTWWAARRFGVVGAAIGLPVGWAATIAVLAGLA